MAERGPSEVNKNNDLGVTGCAKPRHSLHRKIGNRNGGNTATMTLLACLKSLGAADQPTLI